MAVFGRNLTFGSEPHHPLAFAVGAMEVQRLPDPRFGTLLHLTRQHGAEEFVDAVSGQLAVKRCRNADRSLAIPGMDRRLQRLSPEPEHGGAGKSERPAV